MELSLKNVKGVVGSPCKGKAFDITLRCAFMSDACMGRFMVSSQVDTVVLAAELTRMQLSVFYRGGRFLCITMITQHTASQHPV